MILRTSLPGGSIVTTHHLNINDVVLVSLTPHGFKLAEAAEASELKYVNDLSQTKWTIWRLMQVFGPWTFAGGTQIFVDNRLIWTKEEKP